MITYKYLSAKTGEFQLTVKDMAFYNYAGSCNINNVNFGHQLVKFWLIIYL